MTKLNSLRGYARYAFYRSRDAALKEAKRVRARGADAHVLRTETKWPEHKTHPWSVWTRESVYRDMVKGRK